MQHGVGFVQHAHVNREREPHALRQHAKFLELTEYSAQHAGFGCGCAQMQIDGDAAASACGIRASADAPSVPAPSGQPAWRIQQQLQFNYRKRGLAPSARRA